MDLTHFFHSTSYKISKLFGYSPAFENPFILKTAIVLIALSLLISSIALLILALSKHRFKDPNNLIKPKTSSTTLPK